MNWRPRTLLFSSRARDSHNEPSARNLQELEKQHIHRILEENHWNISKTAVDLGIDRVTLYNKIKKYGFERGA